MTSNRGETHDRSRSNHVALILSLMALLSSQHAFALGFNSPVRTLSSFYQKNKTLSVHPFKDSTPQSLLRFKQGLIPLDKAIAGMLSEQLNNNLLELRLTPPAFQLTGDSQNSSDVKLYAGGVPLCGYELKTHVFEDRSTVMIGKLPSLDSNQYPSNDWPQIDLAFGLAAKELMNFGYAEESIALGSQERCYFVNNGELMPAWHLTLLAGGLPYQSYADGYEVLHLEKAYFDASGQALVYPNNVLEKEMKRVTLDDLVGDGTLTSADIKMVVPSSTNKAVNASHTYEYPVSDIRYDEAAIFAYAQNHYRFFKGLGFQWYGPKPMDIKIHVAPGGRRNNALFVPGVEGAGTVPTISIDDGDGVELQNLTRDGDVVSHEFGHFIIYQTLKSTDGESLVLHEGLADFFAFSRTGDACLGDSICPAKSSACWVESRCLRTADNTLAYGDTLWNQLAGAQQRLGHLHGQMVSGLLWDLQTKNNIAKDDVAKLAIKAISFLVRDSGFRDLMLGLFLADKELFASKYSQTIYNAGKTRGLGKFYEDVNLTGVIPRPDGNSNNVLPADNSAGSSSNRKKSKSGCGVIESSSNSVAGPILLGIMMFLPLLLATRQASARALVKAKYRRNPKAKRPN